MSILQQVITILACSFGTLLTRFLPFLVFPANKKTPRYIQYLGNTLAFSAMGLLVIYCLKDVSFTTGNFGLPELISILAIVGIHVYKRNMLLSISLGTILYMVLIQCVF